MTAPFTADGKDGLNAIEPEAAVVSEFGKIGAIENTARVRHRSVGLPIATCHDC